MVYQHSAGDFKVAWGGGHERHFMAALGGALSFALGPRVGAETRGEQAELGSGYNAHQRAPERKLLNAPSARNLCEALQRALTPSVLR